MNTEMRTAAATAKLEDKIRGAMEPKPRCSYEVEIHANDLAGLNEPNWSARCPGLTGHDKRAFMAAHARVARRFDLLTD